MRSSLWTGVVSTALLLSACGGPSSGEFDGWPDGCSCVVDTTAAQPLARIRGKDGDKERGLTVGLPEQPHVAAWYNTEVIVKGAGVDRALQGGPALVEYGLPENGKRPVLIRRFHLPETDYCVDAAITDYTVCEQLEQLSTLDESWLEEALFWCDDEDA